MKELEQIKARLSAATPGPWEFNLGGDWQITANGGSLDYVASVSDHGDQSDHDAVFIAAAPTDVARLNGALEAVLRLADHLDAVFITDHSVDVQMRATAYKIRATIETALGGGE